jgi:hypothetical protein
MRGLLELFIVGVLLGSLSFAYAIAGGLLPNPGTAALVAALPAFAVGFVRFFVGSKRGAWGFAAGTVVGGFMQPMLFAVVEAAFSDLHDYRYGDVPPAFAEALATKPVRVWLATLWVTVAVGSLLGAWVRALVSRRGGTASDRGEVE